MPHGDAVGDGDGAELARRAAAGCDALLHRLGLAHQRDVAGGRLVPAARHAHERLMDLLPREPHRVIEGAVRRALGTLGHVAAGQLRFEVSLRVHWFAFVLIRSLARPPVALVAAYGQIAARPAGIPIRKSMFYPCCERATGINSRLMPNVTPWPQQRPALAKNVAGATQFHRKRNRESKPSSTRALAIETAPSSSATL